MENFLLGRFRAEFLVNWLFFRGGVGVSYLEDGDRAADLGSKPGGVVPGSSPNISGLIFVVCGFSLCSSGFDAGIACWDDNCAGFDAVTKGFDETPVRLLTCAWIGLGPTVVWS